MDVQITGAWNFPTRVVTGAGRIAELPEACRTNGLSRPLLVTDQGLAKTDLIAGIVNRVREAGIPLAVFSDVKTNPTEANLTAGVEAFKAGGHDGVIAVGGGSALDVGKCVAFMVAQSRPVWDFEDIGDWWTRANTTGIAPIIAVPTTAGTGSEVGRAGVITREDTHEKKIIFHPMMMPRIAIEDPELAVGLSPFLTMATGMDALSHCFEAYCVKAFHPLADGVALEGMKIVDSYLPRAVKNGRDLEARAYMFAAASMGATAFQKGLGAIHSVSHPVGARYDTHHGLTNAVVFPYVLVCNKAAIADKIPHIARALNLPGQDFDAVLSWLLAFRKRLGVPHTLAELGVKEADAGTIAADAVKDPTAGANPRPLTEPEFKQLTLAAIRGDLGS
ncbi:iron-containing alcohol dehydrogenase [Bradyrhizobium sp. CCBAU 51753]|uniref:iron-containing alcohol dehydrogenase n=1 Tax=Bradyrhizobium sp. CCBAU 51753 TaxID=1325100 RepID=UPI00188C8A51|nr:iron-containing alcohol dehydrogenase [Bradyrhizobium sp. CCBAU 51753]QOZ24289.1 alcohol dehydrogenase [Bradyrhizobium sp. CCBAU 51753]